MWKNNHQNKVVFITSIISKHFLFSSIYVTHMKSSKWSKINIDKKNREKKKQNNKKNTNCGKNTCFVSFRSLCPVVCCSINQICLFLSITTTLFLRVLLKLYQTQFSCAPNEKSNQIGWILFSHENRWKNCVYWAIFSLFLYIHFFTWFSTTEQIEKLCHHNKKEPNQFQFTRIY